MSTEIKPELSKKSEWWISRHRYYELKHFCLQYPMWKDILREAIDSSIGGSIINKIFTSYNTTDPTADKAILIDYYTNRIEMIENAANEAFTVTDYVHIWPYLRKAVTEGLSYNTLRTKFNIPCSKDIYYEQYRKFFWHLDKLRN